MCVCGCGCVWVINVGSKCISVWIGDGRGWQDNVMQPWYFSMSGSRHRQMVEKVRLCMLFCVSVWWGRGRIKQFSISISKLAKVCSSGKLYKQEEKKGVSLCLGGGGGRGEECLWNLQFNSCKKPGERECSCPTVCGWVGRRGTNAVV